MIRQLIIFVTLLIGTCSLVSSDNISNEIKITNNDSFYDSDSFFYLPPQLPRPPYYREDRCARYPLNARMIMCLNHVWLNVTNRGKVLTWYKWDIYDLPKTRLIRKRGTKTAILPGWKNWWLHPAEDVVPLTYYMSKRTIDKLLQWDAKTYNVKIRPEDFKEDYKICYEATNYEGLCKSGPNTYDGAV